MDEIEPVAEMFFGYDQKYEEHHEDGVHNVVVFVDRESRPKVGTKLYDVDPNPLQAKIVELEKVVDGQRYLLELATANHEKEVAQVAHWATSWDVLNETTGAKIADLEQKLHVEIEGNGAARDEIHALQAKIAALEAENERFRRMHEKFGEFTVTIVDQRRMIERLADAIQTRLSSAENPLLAEARAMIQGKKP